MSTLGNLKPGTLQLLMTTLDPASGASSTFKSLDLILRPDDAVSMDLAGSFGGADSPSLAVSRKNGGRQEMSLQTISRNVPADIPKDIPKDLPNVRDANNLTRTKLPESRPVFQQRYERQRYEHPQLGQHARDEDAYVPVKRREFMQKRVLQARGCGSMPFGLQDPPSGKRSHASLANRRSNKGRHGLRGRDRLYS